MPSRKEWPFPGICQSCVTYLTKAAIPTIEIDYLLNFTTSLPFLLLLFASTQQPTFKGHFREWVRGPLILSHASSFPVLHISRQDYSINFHTTSTMSNEKHLNGGSYRSLKFYSLTFDPPRSYLNREVQLLTGLQDIVRGFKRSIQRLQSASKT